MPRDSSRRCSVVAGCVVCGGVGVDAGAGVTGPLAQQIAQVRERHLKLEGGHWYVIGHRELEDIERHLQDMETALRDVARVSDDALQDGHPGIPDVARLHRIAVAALDDVLAAALPARERVCACGRDLAPGVSSCGRPECAALPAREKGTE